MINRAMKRLGYKLTSENQYGVYYEKEEPFGFTHVVCICLKSSGKHILQSYDKEVLRSENDRKYFNSMCGVEIPVLLLMYIKAKRLAARYDYEYKFG